MIIVSLALVFALGVSESIVRVASTRDEDGNVSVGATRVMPYRVPMRRASAILNQYLSSDDSTLIYDRALGWNHRPNVGPFNGAGFISVGSDVTHIPPSGKLRIALFGGSYSQGSFDSGWWRVLEDELNRAGVPAEVLNFGVGGYGMDQAYLRWQLQGKLYRPHVVLFGFVAANAYDNMNLVRMLKDPGTGIPFTKPRFVLREGQLELLNSPTPAPRDISALLANIEEWEPIDHDWFYRADEFGMRWWRASRLLALMEAKLKRQGTHAPAERFYRLAEEPAQLALAITRQFMREVEASGSTFLAVHLPYHAELETLKASGRFAFAELYDELRRTTTVLSTEEAILKVCAGRPAKTFFREGHYNDVLHAAIGREVARRIAPKAGEYLSGGSPSAP